MNITDFAIIGAADYAVALQPLAVNATGLATERNQRRYDMLIYVDE
ncbi:MAG: hypothetical protein R1F54_08615 [Candidatus Zeuxoniibacter abyssi]|nr:MAG: hypothetical protein R1F54_08615 [Candidatus Persebacteraceae bacterium AB1(2)]